MTEEPTLFQVEESYNLANLKQICYDFVKGKYTRTECEPYEDFIEFLEIEAKYEYVSRLRKIADDIEKQLNSR